MAFLPNNLKVDIFSRDDIPKKKNLHCTHLFSITHPGNNYPPEGIDEFLTRPEVYKFNFHDVFSEEQLKSNIFKIPSLRDINLLIEAGNDIKYSVENGEEVSLFFHCQAGISRSTAAACIVLNVIFGPGFEVEILQEIYKIRPIMNPNSFMIELADKALGRNGKMIEASETANIKLYNLSSKSLWL